MKKLFVILMILIITTTSVSCTNGTVDQSGEENKINIIVSIEPQKTFVEKVVGELGKVTTVIPRGYSPANYQPSPKEIEDISNGDIYFSIGVESEKSFILPKLKDLNSDIKLIDLQNEVSKYHESLYIGENEEVHDDHGHEEGEIDPHIWLSPKRVIKIVEIIRDQMIDMDEIHEPHYRENAEKYIEELETLDKEIEESLKGLENKSFIIYHPAFSYFAEDYGLNMITIEEDGKEATAKRIQAVVDFAKSNNVKVVFYQDEFDSSQAKIIAEEIKGEVVEVTPLSENYIENMREIRDKFLKVWE
jgi:zinc transport system substrate-binding protein